MAIITMWVLLVLPWASLYFMDKIKIRKYMSVALLATVFSTLINQIAWAYNWWQYKPLLAWDKIIPVYMVYGIFMIGTLWIFALTYGRFWLYLIVNFLVDVFFGLVLSKILAALGIRVSGNLTAFQDLVLMTAQGVILYGYQMWQERIFREVIPGKP
ncbi:MAG TPA: hypothetical protein VF941_06315 [Clostridia bacterium]